MKTHLGGMISLRRNFSKNSYTEFYGPRGFFEIYLMFLCKLTQYLVLVSYLKTNFNIVHVYV